MTKSIFYNINTFGTGFVMLVIDRFNLKKRYHRIEETRVSQL